MVRHAEQWRRILSRLPADMAPWALHDIRRSVITHVREMPVNHQSGHNGGVAGVYEKAQYLEPPVTFSGQRPSHCAAPARAKPTYCGVMVILSVSRYVPEIRGKEFACGVTVTEREPVGVVPDVVTAVPDSDPEAVGIRAVFRVALAPENEALAE